MVNGGYSNMLKKGLQSSKCIVLVMLLLSSSVLVVASTADATTYTYGDFDYSVIYGVNIEIKGYHGSGGSVLIPEFINGMLVTSIGDYALFHCTSITSATIPDGVRDIGDAAFRDCTSMTYVFVPYLVDSIGMLAFDDCDSLTTIDVDHDNEFYASVDGVLYDKGINTLIQCPGGKVAALIPASVKTIDFNAFYHCPALKTITVSPSNMNFASVDGVLYNKGVTTVIRCPEARTGTMTIPSSVTCIGVGAFMRCPLTSVTIPASVKTISEAAFYWCASLTSVIIPSSVNYIGDEAFSLTDSMTNLTFKGNAPTTVGTWLWDHNIDLVIYYYYGKTGYTTAAWKEFKVVCLAAPADFEYRTKIGGLEVEIVGYHGYDRMVVIPSAIDGKPVTSIGYGAFSSRRNLTIVVIPDSVTSIGENAFAECPYLTSVTLPSKIITIGNNTFASCARLRSITIPETVQSIGAGSFTGCNALVQMTFEGNTPTCGRDWLNGHNASLRIQFIGGRTGFNDSWFGVPTVNMALPLAPQELQATSSNAYIVLQWASPSFTGNTTITDYLVYRGSSAAGVGLIGNSTVTTFVDTTAVAGSTYYYKVSARNIVGEGALSTAVTVVVPYPALVQVSGRILDQNGKGMPGITVSIGNGTSVLTDAQGNFSLVSSQGDQTLTISGTGIETRVQNVNVAGNVLQVGDILTSQPKAGAEPVPVYVFVMIALVAMAVVVALVFLMARRKRT